MPGPDASERLQIATDKTDKISVQSVLSVSILMNSKRAAIPHLREAALAATMVSTKQARGYHE